MFPASLVLKGKASLSGSDAEKQLAYLLLDENVQVLSSFELNQMASFTYGQAVIDQIFDMIADILAHPAEHSPLTLQKALVVTKHVLIYGSEQSVNSCWALGLYIDPLRDYNTVLIQQQRQDAVAWFQRIKGGGVDKGFPVREAATDLLNLLSSKDQIQLVRHTKADPNSLVPIGDENEAAFCSDEVRHYILQKRIEEQRLMRTRSNLAKERGGFGSGYQSKDGKTVVGAAHSLEEMMARAEREKRKFTDDGPIQTYQKDDILSSELSSRSSTAAPEIDLLDFSAQATMTTPSTDPIIAAAATVPASVDPFAPSDLLAGEGSTSSTVDTTADLLSLGTVAPTAPPFSGLLSVQNQTASHDAFNPAVHSLPAQGMSAKKPVMGGMSSHVDRFAALDALSDVNSMTRSRTEAENCILGSFNINEPNKSVDKPFNGGSSGVVLGLVGLDSSTPRPAVTSMGNLASEFPGVPAAPRPREEYIEPNYTGIAMGASYGKAALDQDGDESGFVMGGTVGSGLEPTAAAPAAPPPPPPPGM